MKLSTLLSIGSILLATSLSGQSNYNGSYNNEGNYNQYTNQNFAMNNNQGTYGSQPFANNGGNVVMHTMKDPQTGMATGYVPLPSNWSVTNNGWNGPENTIVVFRQGGTFSSMERQINSIDQIIQQDLLPQISQLGMRVDNIIELPNVARNNERMYAQYWQAMPCQNYFQAKGIEVTNPKTGDRGLVVVHFTLSLSQYGNYAFYMMNALESKKHLYEENKKVTIYALENIQSDPQYVAAHNQREQQKSQASWSAHNQKMQSNQANFDASQRSQRTLSEAGDISFEGWKRRNQMTDAGHDKTVNGIWEREAMVDPYSNQQVNVESGYKYYYMNQNGQYFGTNDAFYNPAQDPNVNHMEWKKVQKPNNNY